jgi:surfactin synthase thioesterase subunit
VLLLCVPGAGGNAVNFQRVAARLAGGGFAVYGVELPRHDIATEGEELAGVCEVATRLGAETSALGPPGVAVWGHGAGAAVAVEAARVLTGAGRPLRAVVVTGVLPVPVSGPDAAVIESMSAADGFTGLDGLRPERAAVVAAAYRHDARCAERYLMAPPQPPLGVPLVVLTDPDGPPSGVDWTRVASTVRHESLTGTGGQLLPVDPGPLADAVLEGLA